MKPLLHDYWRSSACYRVRIALHLKGVDFDTHVVDLAAGDQRSEAWRAENPQGLVPMLEIDGHRLVQSLAIMDYLDARHEQPPFVPKDPAARSHVLAMALVVACDIHPLNNLRVLRHLKGELGQSQEAADEWYRHWVREGLAALEAMAAPGAGRFLAGDEIGFADICLVPQLYNARRFDVPLAPYPTLARVEASCLALPAVAAAHPDVAREIGAKEKMA
ncbi:maleylacetoacetate isomerase [Sphingomonas ginkgonis]|uniref:Maleylacetoacetate isomerase n=1 Tax=Sphingomonas ginkgonis TaxID=2315330 RepID=A0A3R9Z4Z8_9SPHN|nr:maleylacetoacetate isomerase [Sphingomonas ginkgonis]RST29913.1 maleylacetoacetate isomerase [Sphingomonas ginkgonis]